MRQKRYRIVATASAHVETTVIASSRKEALELARDLAPTDWNHNTGIVDARGLEITDIADDVKPWEVEGT